MVHFEGIDSKTLVPRNMLKWPRPTRRTDPDAPTVLVSQVLSIAPGRTRHPGGVPCGGTCAGVRGGQKRRCGVKRFVRLYGFITCTSHPQMACMAASR